VTITKSVNDSIRFQTALSLFDQHNSADPNVETVAGISRPRELLYAQWLTDWILKLSPDAGEELRLAARCQHLCRWQIARSEYPLTKAGYLQWRTRLKSFHAEKAGELLRQAGYAEATIQHVQALNLKKNFPHDPESRVLEDALCLVFLEHQFAGLARKTTHDKMINALQKAWKKMTLAAREHALKFSYTDQEKALLQAALKE
jgi:hypothetical protein